MQEAAGSGRVGAQWKALAVSRKLLGPWDAESQPWCGSRPRARDVMEFHIPSQGNRHCKAAEKPESPLPLWEGPPGEAPGQGRGEKELPRRAIPKGAWLVVSEQQVQVGQQGREAAPWPVLRTMLGTTDHPALALQCEVHSLKGCWARKAGCEPRLPRRGEHTPTPALAWRAAILRGDVA